MPKVLVIDDDPILSEIYGRQLKAANFDVEVAQDGIEGFVRLQVFHPDVVLLDLGLPYRNGVDWIDHIRAIEKYKDLPVVVLTGQAPDSRDVQAALKSSATQVLFKTSRSPSAVISAVNWATGRQPGVLQVA